MKTLTSIIILIAFATSCVSDKPVQDAMAFDVTKTYLEKEIILADIANITYVHLSTDDDDYLYSGRNFQITKNTITVVDNSSNSILFFSKDGNPKSRFNHFGQGPEDYLRIGQHQLIYDELSDEVYVAHSENVIHVYSSTGIYKRRFTMPQGILIHDLTDYDDHSFFFMDGFPIIMTNLRQGGGNFPAVDYVIPFYRVSKTTGEVLAYVELPGTDLRLGYSFGGIWLNANPRIYSQKSPEGIWLCNIETDTIFLYSGDKSLTPVIYQTPSVSSLNPKEYLSRFLDKEQYQYLQVTILHESEFAGFFPAKYYLRNKKTGETVHPKFIVPDYKGKDFIMDPLRPNANGRVSNDGFFYDDGYCFELGLYELKEADRENKLSGKLKELVATLDEDTDNNVFMLVEFK